MVAVEIVLMIRDCLSSPPLRAGNHNTVYDPQSFVRSNVAIGVNEKSTPLFTKDRMHQH